MYREYSILKASTLNILEDMVNKYLTRGYIPIGGVYQDDLSYFLQAVALPF